MKYRMRMALLLICFLWSTLAPANAVPGRDEFVLVTDLWPPFRIEEAGGSLAGIDIDLARLVETRLGVSIRIVRVPWVRALQMMRAGEADLMAGLARTPEREHYIHYCEPSYASIRPAFYKLASNPAVLANYDDLGRYVLGITRGSAYYEPFDSDTRLNKQEAPDEGQLFRMLLGRRFDFLVGSDVQVDYEIVMRGLQKDVVKSGYQPNKTTALYFGVSRRSRFLMRVPELERVLEGMLADGSVATLVDRYRSSATPLPRKP